MIEQMITLERLNGKVKIRMDFGQHFEKSPWILPEQAPRMVCRLISSKIHRLVKQRKYQIEHAMAYRPQGYCKAISMLEYRLASKTCWNCMKIKKILRAMMGDLRTIAPSRGRYAETWSDLLIGLELFIEEEDIKRKIQELVFQR